MAFHLIIAKNETTSFFNHNKAASRAHPPSSKFEWVMLNYSSSTALQKVQSCELAYVSVEITLKHCTRDIRTSLRAYLLLLITRRSVKVAGQILQKQYTCL